MTSSLIEYNPLLKKSILTMLAIVDKNPDTERIEIEQAALQLGGDQFTRQTPATIIDILIRNAALQEHVTVDGESYEGSFLDIQTDAAVDEEAVVARHLSIAPLGKELLNEYGGDKKLRELLAGKPHYAETYFAMLEACAADVGSSRTRLEAIIDSRLHNSRDSKTGAQRVYPQYFIDSLETAGGITWRESWHITDAGRAVMR